MDMIADILLAAGALGASIYCIVLSRRLKRFNNLQNGMGGAVAVLSVQVDDMTKMLEKAQLAASNSATQLTELTARAEVSSNKLELMMASLHDLPDDPAAPTSKPDVASKEPESSGLPVFLSNRNTHLEAAE